MFRISFITDCWWNIKAEWHIYTSVNQATIGSYNGLLPVQHQAIIWTSVGLLLIGPLATNFNDIWIKIKQFSYRKMILKMFAKWRAFCLPQCDNCKYDTSHRRCPWLSFNLIKLWLSYCLWHKGPASVCMVGRQHGLCWNPGIILCMGSANERQRYNVTSSLIGWAHTEYDPCNQWVLCTSGVLLLNACLTVRAHQANSHKDQGWEKLTDAVISWINKNLDGVVFMLWGAYAQKKGACINKVLWNW